MTKAYTKQDIQGVYAVSGLQQSMLYRSRSSPNGGHYIEQLAFEFENFDLQAMQEALNLLISRYRALRSFFVWREQEEPKLVTLKQVTVAIEKSSESSWQRLLAIDRKKAIALDTAPLIRVTVANLGQAHVGFLFSLHHAIVDGWSIVILQDKLLSLYRECHNHLLAFEEAEEPAWPQLSTASSEQWIKNLQKPPVENNLDALSGFVNQQSDFSDLSGLVDTQLTTLIQFWCRKNKITFASFSHGVWAMLLAHVSGHNDVIYGSIDSARGHNEAFDVAVGMFMQLKPVRVLVNESDSIGKLLQDYQRTQWRLSKEPPPDPADLAKLLKRSPGESLFESVLLVQNYPKPENFQDIGLLNVSGYEQADAPLTVSMGVGEEKIQVLFRYQADRFNSKALQSLLKTFKALMRCVVDAQANSTVSDTLDQLSKITGVHAESLGVENNLHRCVTQFIAQVDQQPDTTGIIDNQAVSYRSLSNISESLRKQLIKHNAGSGDVVGIHLSRSTDAVTAMLAVLALDACYCPLDPNYPSSQLDFMLKDSGAVLVISNTTKELAAPVIVPESTIGNDLLVVSDILQNESMCLIYTSGSTGKPKGVFLQHDGVANRIQWMASHYPYHNGDVCCHRTPLSFVDSVCEIFEPLCAGLSFLVINNEVLSQLNEFIDRIHQSKVSRLTLVPSLLDAILDVLIESEIKLPSLTLCVVSGEALTTTLAEKFYRLLPGCKLLNLYGSTETTADALAYEAPVTSEDMHSLVPIGAPISGFTASITNAQGRKLPMNIIGELLVSGVGVTGGYHGQQNLTREKFVNRSFRTGDLACINEELISLYYGRITGKSR